MPEFVVTAPDGKEHIVTAPEGATPDQALAYAKQKFGAPATPMPVGTPSNPDPIFAKIPGVSPEVAAMTPEATQDESVLPDALKGAIEGASAIPAMGAIGGAGRMLGKMPAVAKALQRFMQTAPGPAKAALETILGAGRSMIPASGRELATTGVLGAAAGGTAGALKKPATEKATEVTGLPESITGPLVETGMMGVGVGSGTALGRTISGGNLKRAREAVEGSLGGIGERLTQRAKDVAFSQEQGVTGTFKRDVEKAGESFINAKMVEAKNATSSAAAIKAAKDASEKALEVHVAPAKTTDEVGTSLKTGIIDPMKKAFEQRATQAKELYGKALESAKTKEAAGNVFAKAAEGRAAVAELQALKAAGPTGAKPLTTEQERQIDRLIETIEGTKPPTTTEKLGTGVVSQKQVLTKTKGEQSPAGHEALVSRLRELRKVDESPGQQTEGLAALGREKAHELAGALEKHLYGWNPEYKAADDAYKAQSDFMHRWQTESMTGATRGEPFDFTKAAASPSEFPSRFFKDGQSVRQLIEATGDPQAVAKHGAEWAAHELRGMDAGKAREWATKNIDWITAAGIKPKIDRYVSTLAQHESQLIDIIAKTEARSKTLAGISEKAKSDIELLHTKKQDSIAAISKNKETRLKAAEGMTARIMQADSKNVEKVFNNEVLPELRQSGMFGQDELDKLEKQVREITSKYQGYAAAKRIAQYTALLGTGSYLAYKGVGAAIP